MARSLPLLLFSVEKKNGHTTKLIFRTKMTDYDSDTTTDAETSTTSNQISIVANTKKRSCPACGGTDHLR